MWSIGVEMNGLITKTVKYGTQQTANAATTDATVTTALRSLTIFDACIIIIMTVAIILIFIFNINMYVMLCR